MAQRLWGLQNGIDYQQSVEPQTITANTPGSGVTLSQNGTNNDLGPTIALINVGAVSGAGATVDAQLEESNDGSTWTLMVGTSKLTLTATGTYQITGNRTMKEVRVNFLNIGGTTPSFAVCATILSQKRTSTPGYSNYPATSS